MTTWQEYEHDLAVLRKAQTPDPLYKARRLQRMTRVRLLRLKRLVKTNSDQSLRVEIRKIANGSKETAWYQWFECTLAPGEFVRSGEYYVFPTLSYRYGCSIYPPDEPTEKLFGERFYSLLVPAGYVREAVTPAKKRWPKRIDSEPPFREQEPPFSVSISIAGRRYFGSFSFL